MRNVSRLRSKGKVVTSNSPFCQRSVVMLLILQKLYIYFSLGSNTNFEDRTDTVQWGRRWKEGPEVTVLWPGDANLRPLDSSILLTPDKKFKTLESYSVEIFPSCCHRWRNLPARLTPLCSKRIRPGHCVIHSTTNLRSSLRLFGMNAMSRGLRWLPFILRVL